MKDLLVYLVTNIVSKPEEIKIEEDSAEGNVNLTLTVDPSDMGLIIGKNGQTIRSIRKLLTVRAIAENVRVNLQLNDPNPNQEIARPAEDESKRATSVDESTSSQ
ncbi:MAG: KH domain-containing protein [Candidatus Daviesbacteria bacterium]|nr:KH domain-containing protein [Candidatus Daviesbacteria bacterium]